MTMDYGLIGDRVDADEGVTIVLPNLPPSSVGPNSRLFYKKKSSEFSSQVEVMIGEINVQGAAQELLWEKVHLDITYVIPLTKKGVPPETKRDLDNLVGCTKAWIDALNHLIIVDDDCVVSLSARKELGEKAKTIMKVSMLQ